MAGCVHAVVSPTGFLVGFLITEVIAQLSTIKKEGLLMIKKALEISLGSFARCCKARAVASWEAHLPSRL